MRSASGPPGNSTQDSGNSGRSVSATTLSLDRATASAYRCGSARRVAERGDETSRRAFETAVRHEDDMVAGARFGAQHRDQRIDGRRGLAASAECADDAV